MRDRISCRGRYFWCCTARDQAQLAVVQPTDRSLACKPLDRLQAYRDPDKISHSEGWRIRSAFLRRRILNKRPQAEPIVLPSVFQPIGPASLGIGFVAGFSNLRN